jgi:chemotaxis protein histidine kinase CheA
MKPQEQAIRISADSVEQLRKIDVFRVLDYCPRVSRQNANGTSKEVALYIVQHRPELRQEVVDCMSELGCELRIPAEVNAVA